MRLGLKDYVCEWEKELNIPLINKSADLPLIDYVIDAWKSLDIVKQIEFKDFIFTDKESSIDINKYIFKREKKKKNKFDIKLVDSDRVGLLTVNMEITMLQTDPTTGEKTYQKYPLTKSMLIPLQDKNGYYHIKGKKYYMIYQLVEKSTYTTSTDVSLKSLMPVSVKRNTIDVNDVAGGEYRVPYYNVYIFKREVPIILFFLANGLWYTMDKFGIRNVVEFMSVLPVELEPDKMYFQLSNKCYMSVYRDQFAEKPFIRSIVGGFMLISTNRTTIDVLKDETKWIAQLSNPNNYDKGKNILKYFNRLLDKTTKKILKVPKFYCNNAYDLLKWQMQHFNELRLKDNCDINNKRLRCNEYIVAPLTQDFSRRLNRIISLGDKVTIDNIKEMFKFPGDILIQKMHKSGLLRFDDSVNDMNFWSKLKYTSKGPHSLGGNNSNNIGIKYRDLHPSMLGKIDILVCGNSDPGTSGVLSPFAKIDGLYFDPSPEPSDFYFNMIRDLKTKFKDKGKTYIVIDYDNPVDFYRGLDELMKYTDEGVTISATSREGVYDIVLNEHSDIDDKTQPQTIALSKKKRKQTVISVK